MRRGEEGLVRRGEEELGGARGARGSEARGEGRNDL